MTRYADPTRCPDCGASITPGSASCPVCALSLRGDTARDLFTTLTRADELLTVLRRASTPRAVPTTASLPAAPATPAHHPRARLSSASVPQILLALGAGCLLVAALVFLAVTWSVMGISGRTATLVGFTVVAGVLAAWMARRGLRPRRSHWSATACSPSTSSAPTTPAGSATCPTPACSSCSASCWPRRAPPA